MTVTHAPGTFRMTSSRWAALAIGVPLALAMIGWLGFTAVDGFGQASFPVGYSIPMQHGRLSLNTGGGNLTVRPGQAARLVGTVHYSLIRPNITRNDTAGGTNVNLHCSLAVGNCDLNATLTVPPRTGLALSTAGGDLSVSGIDAAVDLTSDGGNVEVSDVPGDVTVSTSGGDLTVDDLTSTLSFTTLGGNVNGTALASSRVTVMSYGGDVTLAFTRPPANLTIETRGGNVNLVVPRTTTGYNVTATPSGGNLSDSVNVNGASRNVITVGSEGGDITMTQSG